MGIGTFSWKFASNTPGSVGKLARRREKQSVNGAYVNEVSDSLMLCEGIRLAGALEAFLKQTLELLWFVKKNSRAKNSEVTRQIID